METETVKRETDPDPSAWLELSLARRARVGSGSAVSRRRCEPLGCSVRRKTVRSSSLETYIRSYISLT